MKRRKLIPVLALALAAALTLSGCGLWHTPKLSDEAKDAIKDAVQDAVEDVKNAVEDAAESVRSGESLTERSYEITDRVDSLDLEWVSGKVDIYAAEGDTVRLVERSDKGIYDNEALQWSVEDGELKVRWTDSRLAPATMLNSKDLAVYLPAAAWDELSFETVSADLTVHDALICRELDLDTTSGTVDVRDAAADELDIGSVSGSVAVSGAFREVKTESVSGSVSLVLTSAAEEIKMNSVSGAQTLALPEDCGFTLKFDSVSGTLDSALALTAQGGTYRFGDGGCKVEVETISGNLRLHADLNS